MRTALAILISAILAIVAGGLMQQYGVWLGLNPIAAKCIGIAAFAGTLLGCLIVMALQAGERVEW